MKLRKVKEGKPWCNIVSLELTVWDIRGKWSELLYVRPLKSFCFAGDRGLTVCINFIQSLCYRSKADGHEGRIKVVYKYNGGAGRC